MPGVTGLAGQHAPGVKMTKSRFFAIPSYRCGLHATMDADACDLGTGSIHRVHPPMGPLSPPRPMSPLRGRNAWRGIRVRNVGCAG